MSGAALQRLLNHRMHKDMVRTSLVASVLPAAGIRPASPSLPSTCSLPSIVEV